MTTTERRRNLRAESCRVCGGECAVGVGYLYRDTTSRTVRRLGRFGWFVKCERCHENGLVSKADVKEFENPTPTVRRWSVTDVNKWMLEVEAVEDQWAGAWIESEKKYEQAFGTLVIIHVTVNGERVQLAGGDPIHNRQVGPHHEHEWTGIGGRPFTPAAWKRLEERVYKAIEQGEANV